MQSINYHQLFHSSSEELKEWLEKAAQCRQDIAEAVKRKKIINDQHTDVYQQVIAAEQDLQRQRASLVDALGTPNEERVLTQIACAFALVQQHKERLGAFEAKQAQAPDTFNVEQEMNRLEKYQWKAMAQMTGEVLKDLPEGTLDMLHRAFAVYRGSLSMWSDWLALIFPPSNERQLQVDVAASFGLDLSRHLGEDAGEEE